MREKKDDPVRHCGQCGKTLSRKRFSTGRLEDRGRFLHRQFCGTECQRLAQINPEATHVQTLRSRAQKHRKPACENCGDRERLHVHHRDKDIANNDPSNLQTLCVLCHNRLHAGLLEHLGDSATP